MKLRLSLENVLATLALFLALAGGTAFAASQLGKNSVGAKQLKKNAVTTAKIKKNAVTAAKIKAKAVTGAKIADGAVTGAKIDATGAGLPHVVARLRGSTTVGLGTAAVYPLDAGGYTQAAGEVNELLGYVDVNLPASCTGERGAQVLLTLNAADPLKPALHQVIGAGFVYDVSGGSVTRRIEFSSAPPYANAPMTFAAPAAPVQRNLAITLLGGFCTAGSGITAVGAGIDVVGIR